MRRASICLAIICGLHLKCLVILIPFSFCFNFLVFKRWVLCDLFIFDFWFYYLVIYLLYLVWEMVSKTLCPSPRIHQLICSTNAKCAESERSSFFATPLFTACFSAAAQCMAEASAELTSRFTLWLKKIKTLTCHNFCFFKKKNGGQVYRWAHHPYTLLLLS